MFTEVDVRGTSDKEGENIPNYSPVFIELDILQQPPLRNKQSCLDFTIWSSYNAALK